MDVDTARALLEEERDRLSAVLDAIGVEAGGDAAQRADERSVVVALAGHHVGESGFDTFENDAAIHLRVANELAQVRHAMERLESGLYGSCEVCGSPISDDRLEALPFTTFCVDHTQTSGRAVRRG